MKRLAKLHEYRTFLSRALDAPSTVGAVIPTSRHVGEAVAEVVPTTGAPTVVELGPGTGALTDPIQRRLPGGARHIAVEVDPKMVQYLRRTRPWLDVIEGDGADLCALLEPTGHHKADAVISSIPWTLLPLDKQQRMLDEVGRTLEPGGVFTAITYATALWQPSAAVFDRALRVAFEEVLPRSMVWRNVPPARIYVCRRPTNAAHHGP